MIYNMRGDAYHAGPVMLSDVYTSAVGSAKDGVAASQRALYDAYNSLNSRITGVDSKLTTFSTNTTSALNSKANVFTITNINSGGYSEGGFHIGRAIINNVAYLNLEVGWIILQFEIRNGSIKIREKYGNSDWCSWKALVP